MVSKVRNFWLCVFSGVVATTLMKVLEDKLLHGNKAHLKMVGERFEEVIVNISQVLLLHLSHVYKGVSQLD